MANVVENRESIPDTVITSQRRNSGHHQQASLKPITTLSTELLTILSPLSR